MPRKINVVNLQGFEPVEEEVNNIVNNDELSQIKEAIKDEEELMPIEEKIEKPKAKRKAAAKKVKVVEPIMEEPIIEEPTIEEPIVEPIVLEPTIEEAPKKTKTVELVECGKCGKHISKRTLRYDHEKTCSGEKIDREKIPVKRRAPIKKEVVESNIENKINIPEEIIEQEVKKRIQNSVHERMQQRLKFKEEKIRKLSAQIV